MNMQAIDHGAGGGPEVMRLVDNVPVPEPRAGEVRIRVRVAGVNRPDCLQRGGLYPPPPDASPIIGLECAGEIDALGAGEHEWKIGDAVCALCNGGAYAQYVCVPTAQVLPIPRGFSYVQAAALPENWFTVFHNVAQRGALARGETILIHGGTSGIGLAAIALSQRIGARVLTTVGSDEKAAFVEKLGATPIQYKREDFVARTRELTNGRGADVILDMVGGDYIARNLECLAADGRLVQIAFMQGSKAEINFRDVMMKRMTITGSTLRPRTAAFKGALARDLRKEIWPALESGEIVPVIHKTFALRDAAQAHALMESNAHVGKIMLEVGP
jgi:NADPH:quinone reductase